jgi:hypothetical protein
LYIEPNPVNQGENLSITATAIADCSTYITHDTSGGAINCVTTGGVVCNDPAKPNPKDSNACWWQWTCQAGAPGTYTDTFTSGNPVNSACTVTLSYTVNSTVIPTSTLSPTTALPTNTPFPTATPTETPTPTPTPSPTPAPCSAGGSDLSFDVFITIQNLSIFNHADNSAGLKADFLNKTNNCAASKQQLILTGSTGSNPGWFTTANPVNGLPPGTYDITLYANSGILRKKITDVNLVDGTNNCLHTGLSSSCGSFNLGTANQLIEGDANSDNQINMLDYEIIRSEYNLDNPQNSTYLSGDVNFSGVIDTIDYNLMKNNFGLRGD